MRRLSATVVLCILSGVPGAASALDVWLDSVFGPPDTVVGCTAVVRLGAVVHTRYPSWGTVYFYLDKDGIRIYEDDETFMLNGGDSLLLDWPLTGLDPGYYAARDSLVCDVDQRDSAQVLWKFRVVATAVEERCGAGPGPQDYPPSMVRGVLSLTPASSRKPQAASLLDIGGRRVMDLKPGANDVSRLPSGIYFVRAVSRGLSAVSCHKVVIQK